MDRRTAFTRLRNLLAYLYQDGFSAQRVVHDAGLDSTSIEFSGKAKDNWHAILIEAEKMGKVSSVAAVAISEYGASSKVREVYASYEAEVVCSSLGGATKNWGKTVQRHKISYGNLDASQQAEADKYFREGVTSHFIGDLLGALFAYEQAREIDPKYPGIKRAIYAIEQEMKKGYVNQLGVIEGERIHLLKGRPEFYYMSYTSMEHKEHLDLSGRIDRETRNLFAVLFMRRIREIKDFWGMKPEFDWVRIPAGEFLMGSDRQKDSLATYDELPQQRVQLDEFCISKYPVTNEQYEVFVDVTGYEAPGHWMEGQIPQGKENHPVTNVSWNDAQAFCEWAGVRLPTEAEWEKAARGTDGSIYPWGDEELNDKLLNYGGNVRDTTPVGSYPDGASPYGVLDMAGNVWEWTSSLRKDYPYDPTDGREDPEAEGFRTLRGGAFLGNYGYVRCTARRNYFDDGRNPYTGMRVVVVSPG